MASRFKQCVVQWSNKLCVTFYFNHVHPVYMEKILQVKLTIFEPVVKDYHECSFAISVGEITLLVGKGGDRGPALKVFDENNRGQLGHPQCKLVSALALDSDWFN